MERLKQILKKLTISYIIVVIVLAGVISPQPTYAQLPVINPTLTPLELKEKIEKEVLKPLGVALVQILVNLISFVANRLAYDAAMAIASGGAGQSANIEFQSPEEYGKTLMQDIAGEAIGGLSGALGDIGVDFDVCAPTNPLQKLDLQMGIASQYSRPEPKCDFREIQSNWEGFVSDIKANSTPDKVFEEMAKSFAKPGQTGLSANIVIAGKTVINANAQKDLKQNELLQKDGFKDVKDMITGNVKTPSTVLQTQFKKEIASGQTKQSDALEGALFSGDNNALVQIGLSAGSVFLNTLLSQLTSKIYNGLFEPPTSTGVFTPEFIDAGGKKKAENDYKDLLTTPMQVIQNYNVVNEFVACPGEENRGLNNCVIDTNFAAAIARSSAGVPITVQEAIDAGLLDGSWPLISPKDKARNEDTFCYTYGFCHSNLVKLRAARVIPVGWEMAAERSEQSAPVTLQEAIDKFSDCDYANPGTPLNANYPYCHLIDPNWVIKYPASMCKAKVSGQSLLADGAQTRADTCADTASCLEEDENGNCIGGFGYCTREKNTWRFNGDPCPEQYATCTTLTSRKGQQDSLLTNTLDFANCSEDNAGCLWYRTEKTLGDNPATADKTETTYWENTIPADLKLASTRTYFNKNAEDCQSTDEGCSELHKASESPLNPIRNSSFESDEDEDNIPDYWSLEGDATNYTINTTSDKAVFGSKSVTILSEGINYGISLTDPIRLQKNQFVTVSYHAKNENTTSKNYTRLFLNFKTEAGIPTDIASTPKPTITSENCEVKTGGEGVGIYLATPEAEKDKFVRQSCTFSMGDQDLWMNLDIAARTGAGQVIIDAVQVDEQEVATQYHNGYSGSMAVTNLKIPPDYLNCTGAASDLPECQNYAPICQPQEAGCTAYAPKDGSPQVPGIVTTNDYCPQECTGYETYRQLATNFESGDKFPLFFISNTAQVCTATASGCAEFTNLDTLTEGGESKEYYTEVRVCQEIEEAAGTDSIYYTWEGSENEGFQLKTYTLKQSNISAAPCTNFNAQTGSCQDPSTVNTSSCQAHEDIYTNPDCKEFYDEAGNIHFRLYSETVSVTDSCNPYRKTQSNQLDCQASDGVWNAESGNCTYNILPQESTTCSQADNGCHGYAGNSGNNTRLVFQDYFEEGSPINWETLNGNPPPEPLYSNESVATDGHSLKLTTPVKVYTNNIGSVCGNEEGCETGPSQFGQTCHLEKGQLDCGPQQNQFTEGYSYIISFWAKGAGDIKLDLKDNYGTGPNIATFGTQELTNGWQLYTLGPIRPKEIAPAINLSQTVLTLRKTGSAAYIDNIILKEIQDTEYLIQGSWVTPSTCDQTAAGIPAPQFNLGCKEYTSHKGEEVTLKSFTSICKEGAVGCDAFYKTQQSASPYPQAFNLKCTIDADSDGTPDTALAITECTFQEKPVCSILPGKTSCSFNLENQSNPADLQTVLAEESTIVPRDTKIFIIDKPEYRCSESATGCQLFGEPKFSLDKTQVVAFEEKPLRNLPDTYKDILCKQDDLFCESFSNEEGSLFYFKDPGPQKCEWKTDVMIENSPYFGWFRKGTSEPCYYTDSDSNGQFNPGELSKSYLIGGTEFGIWKNGDLPSDKNHNGTTEFHEGYAGWAGTCPSKQNTCTSFTDVSDQSPLYPWGKPYYFLHNDKLDEDKKPSAEKCNGQLSQEAGCVGFNDAATPYLTFNASVSYLKSKYADVILNQEKFSPVSPVSCPDGGLVNISGETYDLCTRRCAFAVTTGISEDAEIQEEQLGGSCLIDADCGTITDDFGLTRTGQCLNLAATPSEGICIGGENSGAECIVNNTPCGAGICQTAIPTLNNDANTILKVRRDRTCSEWLACEASSEVFDTRTGTTKQVCSSVGLCNEYTSTGGGGSFCSNWIEKPANVLTDKNYAKRNVTWFGEEYTGFSLPNKYGVDAFSQININPSRWCVQSEPNGTATNRVLNNIGEITKFSKITKRWSNGSPVECADESSCFGDSACVKAQTDFRLGVNLGPCVQNAPEGSACRIGVCQDSGFACADSSGCADTDTCILGTSETKDGVCYSSVCLQGIDGRPLNDATAISQECRGYPEQSAPFPWEVVTDHSQSGSFGQTPQNTDSDWETKPTQRKPGFDRANICANGENCECTYQKIEFGASNKKLYFGLGEEAQQIPGGICSGGKNDGLKCTENSDCIDGGTCNYMTAANSYIGWQGLCIQTDKATKINGDQNQEACLQWLPVDELAGATDMNSKYLEAGFTTQNTAYCVDTAMYVTLRPTGYNSITQRIGNHCAESHAVDESAVCNVGDYTECWENVKCPAGYYGIVSTCEDPSLPHVDEDVPDAGRTWCKDTGDAKDDDCPYFCVPIGSIAEEEPVGNMAFGKGGVCEPPTKLKNDERNYNAPTVDSNTTGRYTGTSTVRHDDDNTTYSKTDVYLVEELKVYLDGYASCVKKGVRWYDNPEQSRIITENIEPGIGTNPENFYLPLTPDENLIHNFTPAATFYPACRAIAYTSAETGYDGTSTIGNAAFTNRLLSPQTNNYTIENPDDRLKYTSETSQKYAGQINTVLIKTINNKLVMSEEGPTQPLTPPMQASQVRGGNGRSTLPPTGGTIEFGDEIYGRSYNIIEQKFRLSRPLNFRTFPVIGTNQQIKDGINNLKQFFAEIKSIWIYNDGQPKPEIEDTNSNEWRVDKNNFKPENMGYQQLDDLILEKYTPDIRATGDLYGDLENSGKPSPPITISLGSVCIEDGCTEGEENEISINGQDNQIFSSEGYFFTDLKFFGTTNPNQFPIRNVLVDWGDGIDFSEPGPTDNSVTWGRGSLSGSTTDDNYYKAKRGLDKSAYNPICTDDPEKTHWGLTSESCQQGAFQFQHHYKCTPILYNRLLTAGRSCIKEPSTGRLINSPCYQDNACVFQPRVFMQDNWGYCTGTCGDENEDGIPDVGCYNYGGLNDNECDYSKYPKKQFDVMLNGGKAESARNPWVNYSGEIHVLLK